MSVIECDDAAINDGRLQGVSLLLELRVETR